MRGGTLGLCKTIDINGKNLKKLLLVLSAVAVGLHFLVAALRTRWGRGGQSSSSSIAVHGPPIRILLTDVLFPTDIAAWRLNEIEAFFNTPRFHVDILVVEHADYFPLEVDGIYDSFGLMNYDFLVFERAYSFLNAYNSESFDGLQYIGQYNAHYMLRRKEYRHEKPFAATYDVGYHIFFVCYRQFMDAFGDVAPHIVPNHRYIIHLYPGGGYYYGQTNLTNAIVPEAHIISTQSFITEDLRRQGLTNENILEIYGGPMVPNGHQCDFTPPNRKRAMHVCFTSVGNMEKKGAYEYQEIAERYALTYPYDPVKFFAVGNVPNSMNIISLKAMDQKMLSKFYRDDVDIIFNLDTTDNENGWPLGSEAMLEGNILFSTDPRDLNVANGFNFEFFKVNLSDIDQVLRNLRSLRKNRKKMIAMQKATQKKACALFSYNVTTKKVIDHIFHVVERA